MKRNTILLLILGFSFLLQAQTELPYKSLTEFGNDTISFLKYNLEKRGEYYTGKQFSVLLNDLKIPIKRYSFKMMSYNDCAEDISTKNRYVGGDFIFDNPKNRSKKCIDCGYGFMSVNFKPPYLERVKIDSLCKKNDFDWNIKIQEIFESQIIQSIYYLKFSPHDNKSRGPLFYELPTLFIAEPKITKQPK